MAEPVVFARYFDEGAWPSAVQAATGVATACSCEISESQSSTNQVSTTLPSARVKNAIARTSTGLPEGGMPMNAPLWTPLSVKSTAT